MKDLTIDQVILQCNGLFLCPLVNLGQDLRLSISDYQWLSDSIGSR